MVHSLSEDSIADRGISDVGFTDAKAVNMARKEPSYMCVILKLNNYAVN